MGVHVGSEFALHCVQKQLEEERVDFILESQVTLHQRGSQGHGGTPLASLGLLLFLLYTPPKPLAHWWQHVQKSGSFHTIFSQEDAPQSCLQANPMETVSQFQFLFLDDSQVCVKLTKPTSTLGSPMVHDTLKYLGTSTGG